MPDPWTHAGEVPHLGASGTVTLVEGSAFCISGRSGDLAPGSPQGFFFRDTRFLSRLELRVNGQAPEPLAAESLDPFSATFVLRTRPRPGRADSPLVLFRHRYVGRGLREDIIIRNYGEEPAYCSLEVLIDADFADLFHVKEGRFDTDIAPSLEPEDDHIVFRYQRGATRRGVRVAFSQPVHVAVNLASFEVIVPAQEAWETCMQVSPIIDAEEVEPRHLCGEPVDRATPRERLAKWRSQVPAVETDYEHLRAIVTRSAEDLGALRIFDPDYPERAVVAAGAPWFMTLFGRDSLITAWMALLVDPDLALGVLQTLARFQGDKVDPRYDEEPGKILHEMRFGGAASLSLGGGQVYYGTVDATPLFVMLLGELRRWGLAPELVDGLLPHADRALEWIEHYGDRDGDGYVEYQRASDRGLANQGWKDSWDGVRFQDGRLPRPPVALCEVQAYVYSAYLARAYFAQEAGDAETFTRYRAKALDLKEAFNRDFWVEERGWFAMGLDGEKNQIDALASNMGHCLWTGIVDTEKAPHVAARLLAPDMFSGWGIRTLSEAAVGYNPMSYHVGSVWPHDNALIAAGLMRYGFVDEALRVIMALFEAAALQGHRLPELFSGLARDDVPFPVAYPSSCSPQAWAAASPLLCLRTILRLDPWLPHGKLWVAPVLPEGIGYLRVDKIPLAGRRVTVEVEDGRAKIEGLPAEVELVEAARHPLTAA
jgi:glycogen debranching enzyme